MVSGVDARGIRRSVLALAVLAAALPGGPAQAEEAAAVPAPAPWDWRPSRASGMATVEFLNGRGSSGRGYGLRLSLGVEFGEGWRLELGGGGWTELGAGLEVDRALADVTLARRFWRIEPWVAAGYAKVSVEDGAGGGEGVGCTFLGCLGGTGAPTTMSGSATGPALAAGVRVALTRHLLLGLTARRVLVSAVPVAWEDPGRLDPSPPPVPVGGTWLGLTVAWRFGGG